MAAQFEAEEEEGGRWRIVKQYKYGKRTVMTFPEGTDPFIIGLTVQGLNETQEGA